MNKNRTLLITIPIMVVLLGVIIHQYVYVKIQNDVTSIKESQAIKTETLEKYLTLLSEKPLLEKKLALLKGTRKADDSKLTEGETLSLIAASLQDLIKNIVTDRGGTISSERVGKPEDLGKFRIINVSIDTVLPDSGALSDVLYSIETRTPYLNLKELDIRVRNFRNPRELIVKLDISAITSVR
jgi:hypothetical protein